MVNFDSIPARSAVNIPQHAFDYLGIHRYGEYEATELLTGNTEKLTLMPDKTTPVLLDGMNGKILKFVENPDKKWYVNVYWFYFSRIIIVCNFIAKRNCYNIDQISRTEYTAKCFF